MKYYNKFYDGVGNLVQRWTETWGKEEWLHRKEGPAIIVSAPDGRIIREGFWISGHFLGYDKKGFWALWEHLSEDERNNSNILIHLARSA